MDLDFLVAIEKSFNRIRNHSNFTIRERVYNGSKGNSAGLIDQHMQFTAMKKRLIENPLPQNFLDYNRDRLNKIVKSLIDSIDIFVTIVESGYALSEVEKFQQVAKFDLLEFMKFLEEGYFFDESKVLTADDVERIKRRDLHEKIEDNLSQITSSFAWKAFEAEEKNTVTGLEILSNYKNEIQNTISSAINMTKVDYLKLMSVIATKIRSEMAKSPIKLTFYLKFFQTLTSIFSDQEETFTYGFDKRTMTADDLKQDVEHKINTSKLSWLVDLHSFVAEDVEVDLYQSFAAKLYELSRDSKEEFLWTMIQIAKEQSNFELEKISINYANVATIILSMDYELRDKGYIKLADLVKQIEEITALDAISDISELYTATKVNVEHMISAVGKQLDKLIDYARKILEIDELRNTFKKIVLFTDLDADFSDNKSIEEYLNGLRPINRD